jgi:multiple sugar transport system permease protein/sn-glycerol 3-phosphate transport system permease protein
MAGQTGAREARGARAWRLALPYLLVLPVLVLMVAFIYWPLVYSVYLSTLDWNFLSPEREFVGLANFAGLARSPDFLQALSNTGVYLVVMVPLLVVVPLGFALLLWPVRRSRAQGVYRVVLFAPSVTSLAVMAVVWLWILNPIQGVLNQAITSAGGDRIDWLTDPGTALWCMVLVSAWKVLGFNMILFVAALEAVPGDYLDAARLDGAGWWALFRHVRLPLITPTLFFVVVATVIFVNEEIFAAINIITQGGPDGHTANLLYFLYERGFRFFDVGGASATALVVFTIVAAVTWLQFRYAEGRVHYG